jgi:Putative beta barrel porin-7 (BBP7)
MKPTHLSEPAMDLRARWLGAVLAGLAATAVAHAQTDPAPLGRQYSVTRPDGARRTVVELPDGEEKTVSLPSAADSNEPKGAAKPITLSPADPPIPEPCTVCPKPPYLHVLPAWAEFECLNLWFRNSALPALVTGGSFANPIPGALGQPNTRVLFGGRMDTDAVTGVRLRIGGNFAHSPFGWEAGGFLTEPQEVVGLFTSDGSAVLARPFYDAFLLTPNSFALADPAGLAGVATAQSRTSLWGLELNATADLDKCGTDVAFVGYRFLQLEDELTVTGQYEVAGASLAFLNGATLPPGTIGTLEDRVRVRTQFHGAQVGWKHHEEYGRFGLDARASIAVGLGRQRVVIEGTTVAAGPDGTVTVAPSGLLAQPSNIGAFERDRLAVVPEASVRASYLVGPGIRVFIGYDFLYWASVVRAADQLDRAVDTRQMATSAFFTGVRGIRPVPVLRDTAFWAHGLTLGVHVEY